MFLSYELPSGCMTLRDIKVRDRKIFSQIFDDIVCIQRQTYRFHLNSMYLAEEHVLLSLRKNPSIDVRKIGIVGQDKAIDEIMWSVFEPRKLTLETRQALSELRFNRLDNIV